MFLQLVFRRASSLGHFVTYFNMNNQTPKLAIRLQKLINCVRTGKLVIRTYELVVRTYEFNSNMCVRTLFLTMS